MKDISLEKLSLQLAAENEELTKRLAEADEQLDAISRGEIDGLVFTNNNSQKLIVLNSIILDEMSEGAVTITRDGLIKYSNQQFSDFLSIPIDQLLGTNISVLINESDQEKFQELTKKSIQDRFKGEFKFVLDEKNKEHYYFSFSPLPPNSVGEICIVVSNITELKKRENELQLSHEVLEKLVTERTKKLSETIEELTNSKIAALNLMEDTLEAKEKAERADNLKTEFLSQMSHEIRTPLNAIIGNSDFLEEMLADNMDSDIQESFEGINLASKRIIRTVDLILNFSELRVSGYAPIYEMVELKKEIIDKLFSEHLRSAKQKGIEFTVTSAENNANIFADKYSTNQIFANLIDNAIKYTLKGKVEIFIDKNDKGNFTVEVKDTGIGINKDFLPKLFEPFIQEEQGYSRTYDGNGLGLALVKKYCEINNALLIVESEKNVGSTFRVTFDKNFKGSES